MGFMKVFNDLSNLIILIFLLVLSPFLFFKGDYFYGAIAVIILLLYLIEGRLEKIENIMVSSQKVNNKNCKHLLGDRDMDGQCNYCGEYVGSPNINKESKDEL